jgi:hypothetical protein
MTSGGPASLIIAAFMVFGSSELMILATQKRSR